MKIYFHPRFRVSYQKLSPTLKRKAEKQESIFRANPFTRQLKTHKLHGRLKKLWSFSVDGKNRILFEFTGGDVIFLDIGDHDLYR